ncbi:MAG: RNA 2',3'-cyclic phosphodiesterase [Proteobacteria bacterium]|nr:RNA 2',3'-cyclic phosphodiesterase [Pseudomonadota bacterium]
MTGQPDAEAEPIRAFFAVELGAEACAEAAAVADVLHARPGGDGVRWVRAEGLHVTLRFLGNVDADAVPALVGHVAGRIAGHSAFELALGRVFGLPNDHRPRVVAVDLVPHEPLESLAASVEEGVVAAGFAPEPRSFRVHATLGRVRRGRRAVSLADPPAPASPDGTPFLVEDFVLFRSRQSRSGPDYTVLERIALGAHPSNHSLQTHGLEE